MRPLVLVVVLAVVGLLGFAAIILVSGPQQAAINAPTAATAPASPAEAPLEEAPLQASTDPQAFIQWTKDLEGTGVSVTAGTVAETEDENPVLSDVEIKGAVAGTAWTLLAPRAAIVENDLRQQVLSIDGDATLRLDVEGNEVTLPVQASRLEVSIEKRSVPVVVVTSRDVAIGETGMTIGAANFAFSSDAAETTSTEMRLGDVLMLQLAGHPFGQTIQTLDATLGGEDSGVEALEMEWGSLQMLGSGNLGLDEAGQWNGQLAVQLLEPLTAIDAQQIVSPLDGPTQADMYAKLMLASETVAPDQGMPFELDITAGTATLSGAQYQIPDIVLGTLPSISSGSAGN